MTAPAVAFVIYLWHYLAARLIYDDLVRPLSHGRLPSALVLAAIAAVVSFGLGRRSGRRA